MLQRMFQILGAAAMVATLAPLAWAQDGPEVEQGRTIANQGVGAVPACTSCHGAAGEGMPAAGFPALAALDPGYFARQIEDMKAGTRTPNPAMTPVLDGLTPEQITAVAAYYATLPTKAQPGDAALATVGKELVERGDWDRGIPACVSCHGPGAAGLDAMFPGLVGQAAPYIQTQITAWQQGTRKNDVNGLMGAVAGKLTPDDVKAIGAFLQGAAIQEAR